MSSLAPSQQRALATILDVKLARRYKRVRLDRVAIFVTDEDGRTITIRIRFRIYGRDVDESITGTVADWCPDGVMTLDMLRALKRLFARFPLPMRF